MFCLKKLVYLFMYLFLLNNKYIIKHPNNHNGTKFNIVMHEKMHEITIKGKTHTHIYIYIYKYK